MAPEIKSQILEKTTLTALAEAVGVDLSAVSHWFRRGQIPAERVLEVERLTGVSRHSIRPDIYPIERTKRARTN